MFFQTSKKSKFFFLNEVEIIDEMQDETGIEALYMADGSKDTDREPVFSDEYFSIFTNNLDQMTSFRTQFYVPTPLFWICCQG